MRNIVVWLVVFVLLVALFNAFQGSVGSSNKNQIAYSDLIENIRSDNVRDLEISGHDVKGHLTDGQEFYSYVPDASDLLAEAKTTSARVTAVPPEDNTLISILISWFPMLLLIGVWIFFMRQMQSGGGRAMGFGKSKAKLLTEKQGRVTFEDVAGIDEAKTELEEVVEFLRDPQKFQKLGGKIPKGVLLIGPPGTGKTLLARAIAGEANVPFFTISGSDFVEMFVGVGASRVRDMFEQGKKNAPCIIFIDEIDAVGRHRGAGLGGGNDEREQTLNQLLVEMDGFEANEGVILIAATNRPDVLDPALLRPGRFDRQVVVPNPDVIGREKILNVHMRNVPTSPDVDARTIARGTPGFSGADLANIVNEAALLAARRNHQSVSMRDFEDAKDKVMMGAERRSMVMAEHERALTAYHEAGHAIVMLKAKGHDPLHKVTIIPRGRALGVTMFLPERDAYSKTMTELKSLIASLYGGRLAEELVFGKDFVTTGASDDLKKATGLSRRMVTEFGYSEKLGALRFADNEEEVFLGHSVAQRKNVSDATAALIDQETRRFAEEGEAIARAILIDHMDGLHRLAVGLMEYETLSRENVEALMRGEAISIQRPEPASPAKPDAPTDHGGRSTFPSTKPRPAEA
jgi:cell division protease FtsH